MAKGLSEEVETELEAIKAIFDEDFEYLPKVWNQTIFQVRVWPTSSQINNRHVSVKGNILFLMFSISK